ncbi:hypothetical protein BGP_5100 [Beggiatoa sp. PS]|nr:hypothetical protein BGP_5100 [Beggiatoa sp. PS]
MNRIERHFRIDRIKSKPFIALLVLIRQIRIQTKGAKDAPTFAIINLITLNFTFWRLKYAITIRSLS